MIVFYNILQCLLLPLLPLLLFVIFLTEKYRKRTLMRLGWGLKKRLIRQAKDHHTPVFWIHALSAGESTSALPLVKKIRQAEPKAVIVFSTTTQSGQQAAKKLHPDYIDNIIYSPLDILPVVHYFINTIQPDCYLLIETDFWPNILHTFHKKRVPSLLINGRVSSVSLQNYKKTALLTRPMFSLLDALCMQSEDDKKRFIEFGIEKCKLHTLGNLKLSAAPIIRPTLYDEINALFPTQPLYLLAGSTHAGEEESLLQALSSLRKEFPTLCLIIAPRDPKRAIIIKRYCEKSGIPVRLRTEKKEGSLPYGGVLLLDTIGELAACYKLADIAFIGGSLVNERGHNPLEAALFGRPVLFGPSMEDFNEITRHLLQSGGAFQVQDKTDLAATLQQLLQSRELRKTAGMAARQCILQHQGILDRHLQLIELLMQKKGER